MIEGHDILCFAPGPWDDIWRNRHQIMTRLARANRILYIEPWAELRPTLRQWRRGHISWRDMHGPRFGQVRHNLYVYTPARWAPRASRFPLSMATEAIYMAFLRRILRRLHVQEPILWLFMPQMETFIGRFDEKLVIYHIVDEYAGYSGISDSWRPVVQQMEQRLARRADLVFVTSPELLQRKHTLNEHVFLVPNAVDYEEFAGVSGGVADLRARPSAPADMAAVRPPIAGYIGAINDKLDLALLAEVARRCAPCDGGAGIVSPSAGERQWSFVLVGPIKIQDAEGQRGLQALCTLAHVHFLGQKSVTEVPRYIAACDVCLLPYRINEWTKHIDSLKLYEYLACGKPVIASDVPAARRFSELVRIATHKADWIRAMNEALDQDCAALQAQRQHIAAQNTWDARVAALSTAIENRLCEASRSPSQTPHRPRAGVPADGGTQ